MKAHIWSRRLGVLSGLSLFLFSAPPPIQAAGPSLTVLATSGTAAPGGNQFTGFGDPVLNSQGLVAFQGLLGPDSTGDNSIGLYIGSPSGLAPFAMQNTPAPAGVGEFAHPPGDFNGSGAFPFLPRLDTAGDAFYVGNYVAGGSGYYANTSGVFLNAGKAAVEGDPTPDGLSFHFDFDYQVPPQVSPNGTAALLTQLGGVTPPLGATLPSGIYLWQQNSWQTVVRRGQPTPEGDGTFEPQGVEDVMGFGPPAVNNAGQVTFAARKQLTTPPSGAFASDFADGLYQYSGGTLQKLIAQGDPLPNGRTTGGFYDITHGPAMNASGDVAVLLGTIRNGVPDGSGIYMFNGSQPQLVLHTGQPDPSGSGLYVCSLGHPGLGNDGTLAFTATLGASGTACLNGTIVLYVGQPGSLSAVAQVPISSEVSMQGGPGIGPDMPYVNGNGWVAFIVQDGQGGQTLDVWNGQSVIHVAGTGDTIGGQTITKLDFAGEDTPGATALNDSGELAFRAFSANDSQIVLASLQGPPATPAVPSWVPAVQSAPSNSSSSPSTPSPAPSNSTFPTSLAVNNQSISFSGSVLSGAVGSVGGYDTLTFNLENGQGGISGGDIQIGTDANGNPTLSGTLATVSGSSAAAPGPSTVTVSPGQLLLVQDQAGNYVLVQITQADSSAVSFNYEVASGISSAPPPSQPTPPSSPSAPPVVSVPSTYPLSIPTPSPVNGNGAVETLPAGSEADQSTVSVAQTEFPSGVSSGTVVLASGNANNLIDALTAGPLAYHLQAPLLMTASNTQLGGDLEVYLAQNHIQTVYLIGILGGMDESTMASQLQQVVPGVQVIPISGADRYQTAQAIAQALPQASTLFVASGVPGHLVDAVAATPAAAMAGDPILLESPTVGIPSTFTASVQHTYVVGAAANSTYQSVNQGLPGMIPLIGQTRNQTAALIAQQFFSGATKAIVAPGDDADLQWTLAAAPLAATWQAPIVLAEPGQTNDAVQTLSQLPLQQLLIGGALANDTGTISAFMNAYGGTSSSAPPSPPSSSSSSSGNPPSTTSSSSGTQGGAICAQNNQATLSANGSTLLSASISTGNDPNSGTPLLSVQITSPSDVSGVRVWQGGQIGGIPWTTNLYGFGQQGNTWLFSLANTDSSQIYHIDVTSPTLTSAGYNPAEILWSSSSQTAACVAANFVAHR